MSTVLPASPDLEGFFPPQIKTSYSRNEVVTAISDFYELMVKLPYIDPGALAYPPPEGWSGVNERELRARSKTDEVIELLRHLPYLRAGPGKGWQIIPTAVEIAYCDGEMYDELTEELQPVPGHCIWLADVDSRDGIALLLDTQTGTVTEWSPLDNDILLDYEQYESLPAEDQWMAYPTMPVTDFFTSWKRKFEKLVWMFVPDHQSHLGVLWYSTTESRDDEEYMMMSDGEFESPTTTLNDTDESLSEVDSDDQLDVMDLNIPTEEVEGLMVDAHGEEAERKRSEFLSDDEDEDDEEEKEENDGGNGSEYDDVSESSDRFPAAKSDDRPVFDQVGERQGEEVREIHLRNGWPSTFNREKCMIELLEFLEREEGPNEERQQIIEKYKERKRHSS